MHDATHNDVKICIDATHFMLKTVTNMHAYARLTMHTSYRSSVDSKCIYANIVKKSTFSP